MIETLIHAIAWLRGLGLALLLTSLATRSAGAQSGGFVIMLGADTVQVEQFSRSGDTISGALAVRTPSARLIRYAIARNKQGRWRSCEQITLGGEGSAVSPDSVRVTLQYVGDSIVCSASLRGERAAYRIAARGGGCSLSTIPIGNSFLVHEFALRGARGALSPGLLVVYPLAVPQKEPASTPILCVSPDSMTVDYFSQASSGYRLDSEGRIPRADWTKTTYKVIVSRVDKIDAEATARAWRMQELAGSGFGALSARDTVHAAVGATAITIDYCRPAKRGRQVGVAWSRGAPFGDLAPTPPRSSRPTGTS